MSITGKDLQEMFDGLGKAFSQPGDVHQAAQVVGGKVIEDLHPATTNAKEMTRLLAGHHPAGRAMSGGTSTRQPQSIAELIQQATPKGQSGGFAGQQAYRGTASIGPQGRGYAKTFADQMQRGSATGEPTGSRSKPYTIEMSETTIRNLAKQIGEQGRAGGKPAPSGWERFIKGFAGGREAIKPMSPAHHASQWIGKKVPGLFGMEEKATEEPRQPAAPNRVLEIARNNAARMAQRAAPGTEIPATKDPFGTMQGMLQEAIASKSRADKVGKLDEFAGKGMGSNKGFTETIAAPPMPLPKFAKAGAKATTEAAPAAEGLASLASGAGKAAGAVMGVASGWLQVAAATIGAIEGLKAFSEATVAGNEHLSKWNGSLAIANARLAIGDIKREAHEAGATGGSATFAANQLNNLKEEFQPIAELLGNVKNIVAGVASDVGIALTWFAKYGTLLGPIADAIAWLTGSKQQTPPMAGLFDFLENNARLQNVQNPNAVVGARSQRPGANGPAGMGPASAAPRGAQLNANARGNTGQRHSQPNAQHGAQHHAATRSDAPAGGLAAGMASGALSNSKERGRDMARMSVDKPDLGSNPVTLP